ncbi:tyrosine-protein phosphatase [Microbacterium schleiferi]|uniref:Tyrosine-protein phosphatase n=1 Tax=Microbacterium schleiferi TaxID=69362 RepID=A0A7S8MXX9_9MICO|nr:tyrosine-protein phosphatase [Microbacterium schleiferi]QPE05262.1 tyrosine-protein phosphatase [Microbacterium schleiferi]
MSTLDISGAINFRDTGGLSAGSGRTRTGVLYRSGNLARLDEDGIRAFSGLGIRRVIDLRDDTEVAGAPSRFDDRALVVQRVPLFLGSVASFFVEDVPLTEMYRRLVDDSAARVVEVVRGVIADQPVLVHCTVGKDRTGVTVAITLAAAGVDRDAVIADYARTEALLPASRNRDVVARIRQFHPDAANLEELATKSPAAVMARMLESLDATYGSPRDYLRAHGMSDDELVSLDAALTE